MPIYMDLHYVPGITAIGVAEAHVQDLLLQKHFNCNCMTYWVDEGKNKAFCLIEAPDANAVIDLHNKAHGLIPHQIIEVNKMVVESFLGRIYDPETPEIAEGQLKVFNDSAFRVLMLIKITDPILLKEKSGKENGGKLFSHYIDVIEKHCKEFNCEIAEHNEAVTTILSCKSIANAIACSLSIQDALSDKEKEILDLKISINSGVPVSQSKRIFGDTIDLGLRLLLISAPGHIIISSNVKDLINKNNIPIPANQISTISSSDEKLLNQIINALEENCSDESFGGDAFCRYMGLSKSSLNRATQALMGKSPNALLKDYRMQKAFYLLKNDADAISDVAYAVGFNSPSYFSKCFKLYFNISPSSFYNNI